MRIGRNTSGRRGSSGDGYSLEFFGRDSISFVIKMGKSIDGSSVWGSFAGVRGRGESGAGELNDVSGKSLRGRGLRGKWCGMSRVGMEQIPESVRIFRPFST